nr:MAG TPA: hypothetical protein [Caudoviricetes sp.]
MLVATKRLKSVILFVIQILKLYHTHFYYANKGV